MDWIIILFMLSLVIILFFSVRKLNSEGTKCALDPYSYVVNILEKANKKNITCECYNNPAGSKVIFTEEYREVYISPNEGVIEDMDDWNISSIFTVDE